MVIVCPHRWLQVVVNQILLGLIAALGCLVGGTLLLPSLATDELREVLADIVQQCGYSISGYASRVFPPEEVSQSLLVALSHAPHQVDVQLLQFHSSGEW